MTTDEELSELRFRADLAEIEKEIAWNERRLTNLVFGEEDRQLIEIMVAKLRQEWQRGMGMTMMRCLKRRTS